MKKSEKIRCAMLAVVESTMTPSMKLEVLEMLATEKSLAEFMEKAEQET